MLERTIAKGRSVCLNGLCHFTPYDRAMFLVSSTFLKSNLVVSSLAVRHSIPPV